MDAFFRWARALGFGLLFFVSAVSFADNSSDTSIAVGSESSHSTVPEYGYRASLGFAGGYGSVLGSDFKASPSGEQLFGGVIFGRRTPRWEWDTGLGYNYSRREGKDAFGLPVSIAIRSARADFSTRYRLLRGFSIGPLVAANFGTDTRDTTILGTSVATFYGGIRSGLDLPSIGGLALQAWSDVFTELSSPGRDAFTGMIGIRVGLPVHFDRHRNDTIVLSSAAPEREIRVLIDDKIFFGTSSARIRPEISEALHQAATVLASRPGNWDSIEIDGHTDIRGPLTYNMDLSRKRADSVRKALMSAGLDQQRIKIEAWGPNKPADPGNGPRAWAKNRRVELVIRNVKDAQALMASLAPLMANAGENP